MSRVTQFSFRKNSNPSISRLQHPHFPFVYIVSCLKLNCISNTKDSSTVPPTHQLPGLLWNLGRFYSPVLIALGNRTGPGGTEGSECPETVKGTSRSKGKEQGAGGAIPINHRANIYPLENQRTSSICSCTVSLPHAWAWLEHHCQVGSILTLLRTFCVFS